MENPAVSYFFKKYYGNIIKWWFVTYNPDVIKIYASKEEKEEAERIAFEEAEAARIESEAYNAETGSYSGLYGQQPVDEDTQAALDAIMNISSSQSCIDSLIKAQEAETESDVTLPDEQDEIIREANAIYERLLREAAEDEAKKQAEIENAKKEAATAP